MDSLLFYDLIGSVLLFPSGFSPLIYTIIYLDDHGISG